MHRSWISALVLAAAVCAPAAASAQRLPFERSFELSEVASLDVSTIRGKIEIAVGEPGRIVVNGTVTVRVAWDVPANAVELARQVAEQPPVERDGSAVTLRPPADALARRAVTVSYRVRVPPDTRVSATSDSGATTITGVAGAVTLRTQSGAIDLGQLGGDVDVASGSGEITIDGVGGALSVTTSSSAITARSLQGAVRARTSSGRMEVSLVGTGDVDVATGSSAIQVRGVRGSLTTETRSGRVSVEGTPAGTWRLSSGSGAIDIGIGAAAPLTVAAVTGSGSVTVTGALVQGAVSKRNVTGTVNGGGPLVQVNSRSGSIGIGLAAGPPVGG